ncbi:MAG TPA: hypothetical protein VFF82_10345 [Rhodocyclaceae bacterium]|nr:hypothetical protein [Rhodocyclaceae bacterium]
MAKPNYQFEKRQRDLAKKAKQEEKRQKKLKGTSADDGSQNVTPDAPEAKPGEAAGTPSEQTK